MKLENQLVNLKLAKQLKKAGYPQEGLWWWVYAWEKYRYVPNKRKIILTFFGHITAQHNKERIICVAPTVAELGKMLPEDCFSFSQLGDWHCFESIRYFERGEEVYETDADIEANARAKMWLYLKKS